MKKKKICIITPVHWSHGMGGIEYQVKLLSQRLAENSGVELTYLSRRLSDQYHPPNYTLRRIANDSFIARRGTFADTGKLLAHLKKIKPDVIYENGGCAYTGTAAYYARKSGARLVWHIASDNDLVVQKKLSNLKPNKLIERLMLQWGAKYANVVIAQSNFQRALIARRNSRATFHIVRNFHPMPDVSENNGKTPQIAWVANFKQLKQPEAFIALAKALSHHGVDVRCLMAGAPAVYPKGYQHHIEELIREAENVTYLGRIHQDQVNSIIAKSKLFINTSKWEGFPNTFVQAWMRKTPVVSLHCDPDNVLADHHCGVVSGSLEKMIEDVFFLLKNHSERQAMGENAYKYATRYHSLHELEKLEAILLNL